MTAGAAATTATAVVLLGLAAAHYSFGRRGSRVGAALLAIAVFGSLALPVAARGPGVPIAAVSLPPALATHALPGLGPARRDAAARRRVARLRLAARRRRPAAELRAASRGRCVDEPRHAAADRPGSRVGGGGDRHVPGEERRAIAVRVLRARRHPAVCPAAGPLFFARARPPRLAPPRAELLRLVARAPALEHPCRRRNHRGRGAVAADVPRAARSTASC